jgi:CRISPR-associated exonuclease Cas4
MRSLQSSSNDRISAGQTFITISDVLEYLFCPRFIYYMYCLAIPQHEEKHYKVLKGRGIHEEKRKANRVYLRKKLGCVIKDSSVYLASERYHIKGIVDEVLFLDDGTAAPFEYKFAEFKDRVFRTYRYQLAIQGLLIKENFNVEVNRGFICYTRSKNLIREVRFTDRTFNEAVDIIESIFDIIQKGHYPKKTKHMPKCIDCCYRNICA